MNLGRNLLACVAAFVSLVSVRAGAQLTPLPVGGGTAYYVSTTGSDSNPGTSSSKPFKTIQKAVNTVSKGGDVIYVAPGTYNETVTLSTSVKSGLKPKPIQLVGDVLGTMTGKAAGEVIIDGQNTRQYGIQLNGPDNWTFSKLRIKGQTTGNVYTTASAVENITLDSCTFDVTVNYGLYFSSCGDLAITNCTFNRTSQSGHATYLYQTTGSTMTVTGNRLTMTGSSYMSTSFRTGSLNLFGSFTNASYCYGIIAMAYNTSGAMTITVQNNVVSDSYLGLYAYNYGNKFSSTMKVSHNTVVGCYYGLYVYGDSKTTSTITNNLTGDCYIAAYANSPKGTLASHLAYGVGYNPCGNPSWTGCSYITVATLGTVILDTATFADAANGDFSLVGTVGVDQGTTDGATTTDINGKARPFDGDGDGEAVVDIGAFESDLQALKPLRIIKWEEVGADEQ